MVFCNEHPQFVQSMPKIVTILILIDGFLQLNKEEFIEKYVPCHNPYFNRWFSAIYRVYCIKRGNKSHNPYFNRWFSAISYLFLYLCIQGRHNPYFNRWFSAIRDNAVFKNMYLTSQSLF